jgi:hypothetical protein
LQQAVDAVPVSAKTGAGVPELIQALVSWLVPNPPPAGSAVPFTAELAERMGKAKRLLYEGDIDEVRRILR